MSKLYKALEKAQRERKATLETIETERSPVISKELTQSKELVQEKPSDRSISVAGPNTVAAEEFRKLRTIIFKTSTSKPMQTILVTSAVPREGKSTVASNLALVICQGVNEHALLIDCDLRNSFASLLLRRNMPFGLSDYLMGRLDPMNLIVTTGNPKLSVLPSGSATSNSAELLGSEKMRNLIKTLKSQYANRHIIIDSPPIMSTTEPVILSEMVDGVILVVLAAKTPRDVVQRALNSINKEKILGIVINRVEVQHLSYSSAYFCYPQKGI